MLKDNFVYDESFAKHIAYMATQYDDNAHSVDDAIFHALGDEIVESMKDNELLSSWFEFREDNFDEFYYELYNESLNECLESFSADEIVRKTLFGDFRYMDDYFKLDGYENLESFTESQLIKKARQDSEFRMWLVDNESDWNMEWKEETEKMYLDFLKEGF